VSLPEENNLKLYGSRMFAAENIFVHQLWASWSRNLPPPRCYEMALNCGTQLIAKNPVKDMLSTQRLTVK